jgi:hypothetical protein
MVDPGHLGIDRFAGKGTVQIDQMKSFGAGGDPLAGDGNRVIGKYRVLIHSPLPQTDAFAFF